MPEKYQNLIRAREAGCTVPETVLLTEAVLTAGELSTIDGYEQQLDRQFIIRSAIQSEDGKSSSRAGYFYSPGPISARDLKKTIRDAYTENRKRANLLTPDTTVNLMVSPFIESEVGGVAFTPWLYFHGHSLVEYADTPRKAVAGEGTASRILSHDPAFRNVHDEASFVALGEALERLRETFADRIDVEWCYTDGVLYILQVRPVIIAPTATKTISLDDLTARASVTPSNNLVRDTYAQELGKLSPLSVELLNRLYATATTYWDALDVAGKTSFLERLPNGEVFTRSEAYDAYMKDRHFYSAFLRGFRQHHVLTKLKREAGAWTAPGAVSLEHIQKAFSNWQIAQAFESFGGSARVVETYPGEYELAERDPGNVYGDQSITSKWKAHFIQALMPMKERVVNNPQLAWTSLDTVLNSTTPTGGWKDAYLWELPLSTYAVQLAETDVEDSVAVSGSGCIGRAQVIRDPQLWRGPLPHDSVVVTPYVPTSWIPELPNLTGIMVISLGKLSHAAIVLRESNVPAMTISKKQFGEIHDGEEVSIG